MQLDHKATITVEICGKLIVSSFIQTILLVLELHQIMRLTLADCTANREFHPAPPEDTSIRLSVKIVAHPAIFGNR